MVDFELCKMKIEALEVFERGYCTQVSYLCRPLNDLNI